MMKIIQNIEVSVVVTTYNRKLLLQETIRSILNQTYQNFELIVVDNYSDYDFLSFIESFQSNKIRAFQNHNFGKIATNRNFGISKAEGNYLAFCDDDDIWLPDKLEKQVDYIKSNDVDILSTALIYFGERLGKEEYRYFKYLYSLEPFLFNYLTPSSVLVKRTSDVFFDEDDINCSEDWALFLKLLILGYKLYQMPEGLVKYRMNATNMTVLSSTMPQDRAVKLLKKLRRSYPDKFNITKFVLSISYHKIVKYVYLTGLINIIHIVKKSRI